MSRAMPAGMAAYVGSRSRPSPRIHLFDIQLADGTLFFWSNIGGVFPNRLGDGSATAYKPWVKTAPTIKMTRSLTTDGGEFVLQNVSGNSIDREVQALFSQHEFEGAYVVYRPWIELADAAVWEFHGSMSDATPDGDEITCKILQLFNPALGVVFERVATRDCNYRYMSPMCGMRRGEILFPLTTANIFSANTIGNSGLSISPNSYFVDAVVMIIAGTGAGQEQFVATFSFTTFTTIFNWATVPDATSKFLVTGAGTMKLSPTTPNIFSATTIGKTGLGRTVDSDKDELLRIIAGTGAGQSRRISTNSATTYTTTTPWTTIPDATSIFIVVYRICPKDYDSCNTRGVLPRFPGFPTLTAINGLPTATGPFQNPNPDPAQGIGPGLTT